MSTLRKFTSGQIALAGFLIFLVVLLVQFDGAWRLDRVFYDAYLKYQQAPPPDDIVIIAIDEQSLRQHGRWPWSRALHANLLDTLTREQPKAIAFDIIFSEPDLQHPEQDAAFIKAVTNNAHVVLPVLMEQTRNSGQAVETLPFPSLAEAAAAFGHIHVELDPDSIARTTYLYEGLGKTRWPHLGIAMLTVAGEDTPAFSEQQTPLEPAMTWHRTDQMLIPFQGPPGHFKTISYNQVIEQDFLPGTFRDKYILIGTTAAGLGDALPTPVSGYNHSMSGVELNANILNALLNKKHITAFSKLQTILLSVCLAMLPIFLFRNRTPRSNLIITIALLSFCFLMSAILLFGTHYWFPPTSALLAIASSYPIWGWQRLERTMHFLDDELNHLHTQQIALQPEQTITLRETLQFQQQLLPIKGWALFGLDRKIKMQEGTTVGSLPATIRFKQWTRHEQTLWTKLNNTQIVDCYLGLAWGKNRPPNKKENRILTALFNFNTPNRQAIKANKDIDLRIAQVQNTSIKLNQLNQFIDDSLENMADGILVAGLSGQILLANDRAEYYLQINDSNTIVGQPVLSVLESLPLPPPLIWTDLITDTIHNNNTPQTEIRTPDDQDLLVQLSPLQIDAKMNGGLIINLSDITRIKTSERNRNELLDFLSHDLRAPLVSLTSLIELARNSSENQNSIESLLQRMETQTLRTLNLADQFLQLSRAESSEYFTFTDINMMTVILNAIDQVWALAQAKNIHVKQSIDTDDAWLNGNGELLERAIVNLMENAIKFSPEKSTISVSLQIRSDEIHCHITDQGSGISEQEQPRIFNRFYRGQDSDNTENTGAGLGLALVEVAAKKHKGRVELKSRKGEGSTFCFILPFPA
ncbi:MAG: CHASE2 domain-containing protein [Gammaproteobacteria bacterium]